MKILAQTFQGKEYIYIPHTAGRVSAKNANKVCDLVNQFKELLGCPPERIYHVYDVCEYDAAYTYAQRRRFTLTREGNVKVKNY